MFLWVPVTLVRGGGARIVGVRWTVLSDLSVRIAITPAPRQCRASQGTWTFALRRPIYWALRDSEPLTAASRAVNKGPPVLHLVDIYGDRLEVGSHPVPVSALAECAYRGWVLHHTRRWPLPASRLQLPRGSYSIPQVFYSANWEPGT